MKGPKTQILAEEFGAGDILSWAPVSFGGSKVPGKDLKEGLLEGMVGESMRGWGLVGSGDPQTLAPVYSHPPARGMLECTHMHIHHRMDPCTRMPI